MAPDEMHISDGTLRTLKRPSDKHLAFACAIVRSRPPELTIREYIALLRQHVAKGRRENAISSLHRHLDRSSFWRAEFERVNKEKTVAQDEVIDLEREIQTLKAKIETTKSNTNPTKKRKKATDDDVVPYPRSPKRPKVAAPSSAALLVADEFDFAHVGEIGNILMRSLYQIHVQFQARQPDTPILAYNLIRAAATVPQVVHHAVKQSSNTPGSDISGLKSVTIAACRSFTSLMAGLDNLSDTTERGHVVYNYINAFSSLLDVLQDAAMAEAKRAAMLESGSATAGKSKGKAKTVRAVNIKDAPVLNLITTFLNSLISLLEPSKGAHASLFEGYFYASLNKLGHQMYLLTFGQQRGGSLADEITGANITDDVGEDDQRFKSAASVKDGVEKRAAKLEAPYLIHLLNRLMTAAPKHFGSLTSSKTGKPKQANNKGSMKGALALDAKNRLQRTLISCMFGTEGVGENNAFMDCLKVPGMTAPALQPPKIKEVDVQEWFKEEVWRLLGWEVLSKEVDWEEDEHL